jgi:hypothetical protein|nr:MAG TPA: hypothetical protein [Caudoviricetes sp.]
MNKYFINDVTAKIFFLVELDGKQQMDFLGIRPLHFTDKDIAKSWYENLKAEIENSNHEATKEALASLDRLYKGMK